MCPYGADSIALWGAISLWGLPHSAMGLCVPMGPALERYGALCIYGADPIALWGTVSLWGQPYSAMGCCLSMGLAL